jgi:hypothetical protein
MFPTGFHMRLEGSKIAKLAYGKAVPVLLHSQFAVSVSARDFLLSLSV